ncbi:hypothetical protein [Ruegeria sp. HKCCD6119]|uniref:hypothetical protein n=1 Tax=Ruegeria sp. HKCCD6119 TaxID=2683003 RepID=UPI0014931232|nr:hypothetical protein [Ruegeria sp. HKCCD6119]NOD84520.1 hypothetical protein [Ruegeria sp. HKCCD6119]
MSEAEAITACENMCRDFGFLLSDWLKSFAQNPIWALVLGGIISLLIWRSQIKLSERIQFNREKRELYASFVNHVEVAHLAARTKSHLGVNDVPEIMMLLGLQKQINLIAERDTAISASQVVGRVGAIHARVEGERESYRETLQECEDIMRKELARSESLFGVKEQRSKGR